MFEKWASRLVGNKKWVSALEGKLCEICGAFLLFLSKTKVKARRHWPGNMEDYLWGHDWPGKPARLDGKVTVNLPLVAESRLQLLSIQIWWLFIQSLQTSSFVPYTVFPDSTNLLNNVNE